MYEDERTMLELSTSCETDLVTNPPNILCRTLYYYEGTHIGTTKRHVAGPSYRVNELVLVDAKCKKIEESVPERIAEVTSPEPLSNITREALEGAYPDIDFRYKEGECMEVCVYNRDMQVSAVPSTEIKEAIIEFEE